jgi:hypothetical protein
MTSQHAVTKGLPAHRQRQHNPQVKLMDPVSANISGGSTLSTKNRVAYGSSAQSFGRDALKSISHLNFKKIPQLPAPPIKAKKPSPAPQLDKREPEIVADDPSISEPALAPPSPIQEFPDIPCV